MAQPLENLSRLLIVLPSWVGDSVMATPMLRAVRAAAPGVHIAGLCRPGIDEVLAGSDFFNLFHVERLKGAGGVLGAAGRLAEHRFDAALILPNSFSSALAMRLARIPRRIGYDRDGRHRLLTDRLRALKRRDLEPFSRSAFAPGDWAPVPATSYYFALGSFLLKMLGKEAGEPGPLELSVSADQQSTARGLLRGAGVLGEGKDAAPPPLAMLCPGGNRDEKRWPIERFAAVAEHLVRRRGLSVLISGSPGEAALTASVRAAAAPEARDRVIDLVAAGESKLSLGALKGVIRACRLLITNDTGPRHIAAALGVPVISLFGPTDPRWTTIPFARERVIVADPTLPPEEVADDHPERCRIDRISVDQVVSAIDAVVG